MERLARREACRRSSLACVLVTLTATVSQMRFARAVAGSRSRLRPAIAAHGVTGSACRPLTHKSVICASKTLTATAPPTSFDTEATMSGTCPTRHAIAHSGPVGSLWGVRNIDLRPGLRRLRRQRHDRRVPLRRPSLVRVVLDSEPGPLESLDADQQPANSRSLAEHSPTSTGTAEATLSSPSASSHKPLTGRYALHARLT